MSAFLKSRPSDNLYFVQHSAAAAPFVELSRVMLIETALTDDGEEVPAFSAGTVVGVWGGGEAYDVEFTGAVEALVTVQPNKLRAVDQGG